jgi:hypothetical protein
VEALSAFEAAIAAQVPALLAIVGACLVASLTVAVLMRGAPLAWAAFWGIADEDDDGEVYWGDLWADHDYSDEWETWQREGMD